MHEELDRRRRDLFAEIMMMAEEGMDGLDSLGDDSALVLLLEDKIADLKACLVAELHSAADAVDREIEPVSIPAPPTHH